LIVHAKWIENEKGMGSFFLARRVAVFDKIKFAMHIVVSDGNSLNLDFC
jgi:hypothetical protein